MRLNITHKGSELEAFEGDLSFIIRDVPIDAKIQRAVVTLKPIAEKGGTVFHELLSFADGGNAWGSSKNGLEASFNARRTPIGITLINTSTNGSAPVATTTHVRVDVGAGSYIQVLPNGEFANPETTAADKNFAITNNRISLPGVDATRLRIDIQPSTITNYEIQEVMLRAVPSNVHVRFDQQGAFWVQPGLMGNQTYTTPNFADILNLYLLDAEQEGNAYVLPINVHSDTIARLDIEIVIDYVIEKSLLPANLPEITMPYSYDDTPSGGNKIEALRIPRGSQIVDAYTTVDGVFEDVRIVDYEDSVDLDVEKTRTVRVNKSPLAQAITVNEELLINGIDLLLSKEKPGTATIQVAIHEDEDGKPGREVLLGNQNLELFKPPTNKPVWEHLNLTEPFRMIKDEIYWLVVQTDETDILWRASEDAIQQPQQVTLQRSESYGLAWRSERNADDNPLPADHFLSGFYRLRLTPAAFSVPLQLRVGNLPSKRHKFDEFAPLGRVEYNTVNIKRTIQSFIEQSADEQLDRTKNLIRNGGFEEPVPAASSLTAMQKIDGLPRAWTNTSDQFTEAVSGLEIVRAGKLGRLTWKKTNGKTRVASYLFADRATAGLSQEVAVKADTTYDFNFFYQTDFRTPRPTQIILEDTLSTQQTSTIQGGSAVALTNPLSIGGIQIRLKTQVENPTPQNVVKHLTVEQEDPSGVIGIGLKGNRMEIELPFLSTATSIYLNNILTDSHTSTDITFYDENHNAITNPTGDLTTTLNNSDTDCYGENLPDGVLSFFNVTDKVKYISISGNTTDVYLYGLCYCPEFPCQRAKNLRNELLKTNITRAASEEMTQVVQITYRDEAHEPLSQDPQIFKLSTVAGLPMDEDGLYFFSTQLIAPENAHYALVSFIQEITGIFIFDDVSLKPTGQQLKNTNFTVWENAGQLVQPSHWEIQPKSTRAITRLYDSEGKIGGVQLVGTDRNLQGSVQISQIIKKIEPKRTYEISWEISVSSSTDTEIDLSSLDSNLLPKGYVEWQSDDPAASNAPSELSLSLTQFTKSASFSTQLTAPENATHAKIIFRQPIGEINLHIHRISFVELDTIDIPFTFLSQAPGNLIVHDLRVVFDRPPETLAQFQSLYPSSVLPVVEGQTAIVIRVEPLYNTNDPGSVVRSNMLVKIAAEVLGGSADEYVFTWEIEGAEFTEEATNLTIAADTGNTGGTNGG